MVKQKYSNDLLRSSLLLMWRNVYSAGQEHIKVSGQCLQIFDSEYYQRF